jgi:DNA polymerase
MILSPAGGTEMADGTEPVDPRRLARQCLDSLRVAGVDWLPKGMPERIAISSTTEGAMPKSKSNASRPSSHLEQVVQVTAAEPGSIEQRRIELQTLAQTVSTCTRCPELASTRTQTVFGVGQPGVELCFVGEAPGADEDRQGEPFVGAAGQLLNKIIVACGFQREEVYICNTIKCRPPGNRTPLPNEMGNCREFFDRQLELVKPKFICALGGCAASNLLNSTLSIGKLRGRFHEYRGIPVIVTYHPAYLLPHRAPHMKKEVWADMKMLLARMGRPVPEKPSETK